MNHSIMTLTPEDAALLVGLLDPCHFMRHTEPAVTLITRLRECAALVPPPLNGDKVWYGLTTRLMRRGHSFINQSETIVRAKSKTQAVELLRLAGERMSITHFSNYWSVTGNRESLCAATERGVFVKGLEGWVKRTVI